jgi:molecular chaperone HscB
MSTFPREYYEFFGMERKLSLDESLLQNRFYELSRQWHPDRFTRRPPAEQAEALDATSVLNDGYRTLRDPIRRAEYVLEEEGFPIGEQRSKDVPPELLEEVFDLNMMLEELKSGDEDIRPQLEAEKQKFNAMREQSNGELERLFAKFDASEAQSETAKRALHEVRGVLNRRRYIENLIHEVDRALAPHLVSTENVEDRL